jgi:hypothetical protein
MGSLGPDGLPVKPMIASVILRDATKLVPEAEVDLTRGVAVNSNAVVPDLTPADSRRATSAR